MPSAVNLLVEVHAALPNWTKEFPEFLYRGSNSDEPWKGYGYRLYINDELFSERPWYFPLSSRYLVENIWVEVEPNRDYTIFLHVVEDEPERIILSLKNFQTKNIESVCTQLDDRTITFRIV